MNQGGWERVARLAKEQVMAAHRGEPVPRHIVAASLRVVELTNRINAVSLDSATPEAARRIELSRLCTEQRQFAQEMVYAIQERLRAIPGAGFGSSIKVGVTPNGNAALERVPETLADKPTGRQPGSVRMV